MRTLTVTLGLVALAACNEPQPSERARPIKVRSSEQNALHQLDALNLAIGLKRAIYDAGFLCKRITDAGFVGEYKNLDMWTAHCTDGKNDRDWAVFAGPDGSAQVRDCADVVATGLPKCEIRKRPKGTFGEI